MSPIKQRLNRSTLRGVWAALIIPWDENFKLRADGLAEEVRHYAASGMHGVYTGGTTGEFYAQDDSTYAQICQIACEAARSAKIPIQIGCTALSNPTTAERIRVACSEGADALQFALPFWLELKDDEILSFFECCAKAAGEVPLIFYTTLRAKRKPEAALLGRLAREFPTFIGMKDTGCDVENLRKILDATGGLSVFGGEHSLLQHMPHGGLGCYSSWCGTNPRLLRRLYELCAQEMWEEATPLHQLMEDMVTAITPMLQDGLMDSAIDRALRILGGGKVGLGCAGPYRSATPEQLESLRRWLETNAPAWLVNDCKK